MTGLFGTWASESVVGRIGAIASAASFVGFMIFLLFCSADAVCPRVGHGVLLLSPSAARWGSRDLQHPVNLIPHPLRLGMFADDPTHMALVHPEPPRNLGQAESTLSQESLDSRGGRAFNVRHSIRHDAR